MGFVPDYDTHRVPRPTTPAIMLSLVLTILFVHIAIYLVNTIGASTIDSLVRGDTDPDNLHVKIYPLERLQHVTTMIPS